MQGAWTHQGRALIAATAAAALLAVGQAAIGSAQAATTVTVNPSSPMGGNEFPFGRADLWPQMGFVYKNVPAFNLKAGDNIAFDLSAENDVNIQLQVEMAPTTVNGGDVPGAFTTVVPNTQLAADPNGNTTMATMPDYELQFTAVAPFNFAGGGLIIRFSNPGGAYAADTTPTTTLLNVANSSDPSGFFVKRFYNDADGLPPYDSSGATAIAGFRLTIQDMAVTPLTPAPLAPTTAPRKKKKCKKKKHKGAAAAKKKCKKRKK